MKKSLLLVVALMFSFGVFAQDEAPAPKMGWERGAGFGLDLAQLLIYNPKVGAGENKIGVGGAITYFANYKKDRLAWDNLISLSLGVQRLGQGLSTISGQNGGVTVPWQKSVDELRFNSKAGYATSEGSKWFYASDLSFLSQLLPTYSGNLLSDALGNDNTSPISKLFSPATITYGLGMDYKHSDNLSFYLSPVTLKAIIVSDDVIANMEAMDENGGLGSSFHGNPWRANGDFDNNYIGVGALARAIYLTKLWNDRIVWKSNLSLFTDYKNNPFTEIDVDWNNEFAVEIVKGLSLTMMVNLFYDDDVPVQITDFDAVGGVAGMGKRASITEQMLLKYTRTF